MRWCSALVDMSQYLRLGAWRRRQEAEMGTIREIISRHESEILQRRIQAARHAPSERSLTLHELNTMPAYLSALGTSAGDAAVHLSEEQRALVEHYLSSLLRSGFNLNEILNALTSLGRCVSEAVKSEDASAAPAVSNMEPLFPSSCSPPVRFSSEASQ
jgi:hypothetical protein